ncbi:unnamed protein product, partial [Nesidiocoris tenuis]
MTNGGGRTDEFLLPYLRSKWTFWNRPKIEDQNGASEKTFSYTHLLEHDCLLLQAMLRQLFVRFPSAAWGETDTFG